MSRVIAIAPRNELLDKLNELADTTERTHGIMNAIAGHVSILIREREYDKRIIDNLCSTVLGQKAELDTLKQTVASQSSSIARLAISDAEIKGDFNKRKRKTDLIFSEIKERWERNKEKRMKAKKTTHSSSYTPLSPSFSSSPPPSKKEKC